MLRWDLIILQCKDFAAFIATIQLLQKKTLLFFSLPLSSSLNCALCAGLQMPILHHYIYLLLTLVHLSCTLHISMWRKYITFHFFSPMPLLFRKISSLAWESSLRMYLRPSSLPKATILHNPLLHSYSKRCILTKLSNQKLSPMAMQEVRQAANTAWFPAWPGCLSYPAL